MFIDHIGFAVADYERSKAFYRRCLAPLGLGLIVEIDGWAGFGRADKAELWFGEDAMPQHPMHIDDGIGLAQDQLRAPQR